MDTNQLKLINERWARIYNSINPATHRAIADNARIFQQLQQPNVQQLSAPPIPISAGIEIPSSVVQSIKKTAEAWKSISFPSDFPQIKQVANIIANQQEIADLFNQFYERSQEIESSVPSEEIRRDLHTEVAIPPLNEEGSLTYRLFTAHIYYWLEERLEPLLKEVLPGDISASYIIMLAFCLLEWYFEQNKNKQ